MPAIKRMLVPTDFSPTSDVSFKYALDLASRDRSAMHVLHVVDDGSVTGAYADGIYVEVHGLRARLTEAANARLRDLAAQCERANLSVTTEVVTGRPASVIAERATALRRRWTAHHRHRGNDRSPASSSAARRRSADGKPDDAGDAARVSARWPQYRARAAGFPLSAVSVQRSAL